MLIDGRKVYVGCQWGEEHEEADMGYDHPPLSGREDCIRGLVLSILGKVTTGRTCFVFGDVVMERIGAGVLHLGMELSHSVETTWKFTARQAAAPWPPITGGYVVMEVHASARPCPGNGCVRHRQHRLIRMFAAASSRLVLSEFRRRRVRRGNAPLLTHAGLASFM